MATILGTIFRNYGQNKCRPDYKVYLTARIDPKVSCTIKALPFTPEGFNRAKSISKEKFGKDYKIIKAYTREVLGLPK